MATTLGSPPNAAIITTGGANVVHKVTAPAGSTRVTFKCRTNAGKVSFGDVASGLTDGGALGGNGYVELPADTPVELACLRGASGSAAAMAATEWYVTSATGSTVIEVVAEVGL